MTVSDEFFLRRAIALAIEGRERGSDPFGAVLVKDGQIVRETFDRCVETSDPTFHAELSLISDHCRENQLFALPGYALYASTEPCPMCAGAIHWSRIARLVFSVSQAMLQERSGGSPKLSCDVVLDRNRIEIIGPLLPDEGLKVFDGYAFVPKIERHRRRFNDLTP
ncbi:MAG TPA: nucleoside deaminase [Phototrophicaceae bacterium]|nr:nucleoside deaminase [Phototrophicaceae bacterium]